VGYGYYSSSLELISLGAGMAAFFFASPPPCEANWLRNAFQVNHK